jgi:hypothetical protein
MATVDGFLWVACFVLLACIKDYQNDNFECKTNNFGYNILNQVRQRHLRSGAFPGFKSRRRSGRADGHLPALRCLQG